MLLPSDVARLVLGYLQEEGLSATSQAFIHESPNLKEYAEHSTGDGTIPACVFAIFGKNLTSILNEYVAAKAKESGHEVPLVMTSLWKKLDFTLNQIKSLQNSPAISASQRTRSRIGVANMARQRVLAVTSAGGVVCSSVSETSSIISPVHTTHSLLGHSAPVSYAVPQIRAAAAGGAPQLIQDGGRLLNPPRDSPVQVIVSEHRLNSGPVSPGRRKWDTPRKRSGLSGSSGPSRSTTTVSLSAEAEPEEVVDENFPQLVIQNARDKILGDRLLQEKLAENINKILASEPTPQASKVTVEAEQSIDEILGLQGEIHMSDDAIHDILEQTESDPAFQALFDLFEYHKTKSADGEAVDGDASRSPEENETAGPSSAVQALQSNNPDPPQQDANVSDAPLATPLATLKTRAGQERKTKKSTGPTLIKKTLLDSSGRASRIENSSARLLVSHGEPRSASSAAVDSSRKEAPSLLSNSGRVARIDIDEPLHTPPPPLDSLVTMEPTATFASDSAPVAFEKDSAPFADVTLALNVDKNPAPRSNEQPVPALPSISDQPQVLSSVDIQGDNNPAVTANKPHPSLSTPDGDAFSAPSVPTSVSAATALTAAPSSSASTPASSSEALTATAASSALSLPALFSSCAPVPAARDPSSPDPSAPNKAAGPSNMVSLKIIVSDNQDEDSPGDAALNQAISSISGDKIPTIYLSSPAKSPGCPATPKANFDEVAQAVSGLQSSEVYGSPLGCKAAAVCTTPLTGTAQTPQRYIIQLPGDGTSPVLQASAASYFLVSPTADVQGRQMLLPAGVSGGQPLPPSQPGVTTPTPNYPTGSALILPSPVKPVVLPVSVLGPNPVGKVPTRPNQQIKTIKPRPVTVAPRRSPASGTEKNVAPQVARPEDGGRQDAAKGSSHKRILRFDSSSSEVQSHTAKTTEDATPVATKASALQPVRQSERDKRTKPNILGGNKPKRRIETVRCSADPQAGVGSLEPPVPFQVLEKDLVKKNSRKQVYNIHDKEPQNAGSDRVSRPECEKNSEPADRLSTSETSNDETKAKDAHSSSSSDSAPETGSRKDKEESSGKEAADKALLKSREGRAEKRPPSQEVPSVTANKENELKGSRPEQQSAPSSSAAGDFSPPAVPQLPSHTPTKTTKAPSKASPLAKQAVEMLQDILGLNAPVNKAGASGSDPGPPGTGQTHEAPAECPRTPSRQKRGKDGEGTSKHLIPPNTPDVPTCSPASEAGSENSINMAAHTLMILSRAAIARTGTPLKDSMRQEGAGEKLPVSSKNSKKRKQSSPSGSPPAKRESRRSPSRKKERERKKLVDCFPRDLDVDKFLSSLHYDQ
ncbi:protein NPAT isoform X2 [Kryptolebias marmoratus]|uniref:protein NPAT isoform X2 n=1 Tax=Kryptolebias marmoratus TaxID=37003 RepID=UPI0007F8A1D2|nr:protein NPAT isoform X2 [Kryptolebias marmoratus]